MVDTALTVITDALLDLGVIADGETPSASQASGGLRKLNNMIDGWNIESLMIYGVTPNVFPLVPNKGAYTLGTGGDFNIPRPNSVESVYVRDTSQPVTNQIDYPVALYNDEEYADIRLKGQTASFPYMGVWIKWDYPLANVYVTPIPTTGQYSLVVWTEGILANYLLDTVISLPPGYKRALTANLSVELAPSYGQAVTPELALIAKQSKDSIKVQNVQVNRLKIDPRLAGSRYNILTNGA